MPALIPAILKGIVFLFLLLLGLLLLLVLLLLFVPFCYRGNATRIEGTLNGVLRVSWLFSLLRLQLSYAERVKAEFYLLCFRIYRLENDEDDAETEFDLPETTEEHGSTAEHVPVSNQIPPGVSESDSFNDTDAKPAEEALRVAEEKQQEKQRRQNRSRRRKDAGCSAKEEPKQGKLAAIWNRLQQLYQRAETEYDFFQNERTQRFLAFLKRKLFRFIRELFPRRISGELRFGFANPATTGQGAALAALLLPFYRDSLRIEPLFDREELSGELSFRGHLQLYVFLFGAAQLWFHRDFRYVYRHIRGKDKRPKTEEVYG